MKFKNRDVIFIFLILFTYLLYRSYDIQTSIPEVDINNLPPNHCVVEKVVDGDTIWCTFADRSTKIRLLAVDAAETTFGKDECYGEEATIWLKQKILNKTVRLEYDKEEPTYGNYDRLLAYIWFDDTNINFELIKRGYAEALTKYPIHRYSKPEVIKLEDYARKNNLGLWKVCKR